MGEILWFLGYQKGRNVAQAYNELHLARKVWLSGCRRFYNES